MYPYSPINVKFIAVVITIAFALNYDQGNKLYNYTNSIITARYSGIYKSGPSQILLGFIIYIAFKATYFLSQYTVFIY